MELVVPSEAYLASYVHALERGWSPDNLRPQAGLDELERIRHDAGGFLASRTDPEAKAGPVVLPDGSTVPRLPGYNKWMWDGEFCGVIGIRWQPGTAELPPHCLGHIGYSVVPWKRRLGYATLALRQLLPDAKRESLRYVHIATTPDNIVSQRVIEANGGVLVEEFVKPPAFGSVRALRYRVKL